MISNIIRNRHLKVPDKHAAKILIAKSSISNHAAAGIRDDPCLSKFGALCGLSDTLLECPNVAVCLFWNFFVSGFPVILLITPKRDMLIAAVPFLWGVPYTGIKKEYKNGLRRMETLTIVESGGLACYHWKMFHITIRSKTGGTDHGCEYDRTVRAGSAGAP